MATPVNYNLNYPNSDFLMRLVSKEFSGLDYRIIGGVNDDIDVGSKADIWTFGGLYNFSQTADIDSISSSKDTDNQYIKIFGLDEDYNEISEIIQLQGQSKVQLTKKYLRINGMYNIDDHDIEGVVYCYVNTSISGGVPSDKSKVRAVIDGDANQTEMAIYTVPAGKTFYMLEEYIAFARARDTEVSVTMRIRMADGVFQVKHRLALTANNGMYSGHYGVPMPIPEKTDIIFRVDEVTRSNASVTAAFLGILKNN